MDGLGANPLGILTFIVAPAILTNASSVMALGTANRFARTGKAIKFLDLNTAAEISASMWRKTGRASRL